MSRCILLLFSCFAFFSCQEVVKQVATAGSLDEDAVLIATQGKHFTLGTSSSAVYLPDSFKKTSITKFSDEAIRFSSSDSAAVDSFVKMFRSLRDQVEGDFDLFFSKELNSFCTVNTLKYFDFNKQDARYILGMIRKNQETGSDLIFEKQAANYNATEDVKIFKAVYKLSNFDETRVNYRHIYILSTPSKKTFQLIFNTPFEADLDPFIRRMKI